jgi:pterin-4a-carbinolamine dehydratase
MTAPKKLSPKELTTRLKALDSAWESSKENTVLKRSIVCHSYVDAVVMAGRIAVYAEVHDQTPELTITKSALKVTLQNKQTKLLTPKEFELATHIDHMLSTIRPVARHSRR